MILIATNRDDQTSDWLILELQRRGTPYVRFNTEDYPASARLTWSDQGVASLALARHEIDLTKISAVWYRRPIPGEPDDWSSLAQARWALGEARAALEGVWRTLDVLWVNHPDRNRVAGLKLEQLRRARDLGLTVPRTLVTNDPERLRLFARESEATGVVCKPLDNGRLEDDGDEKVFFTSRFELSADDPLVDFGPEPYLFQEFIPKTYDVRVTVIGHTVFATRIESQSTDKGQTDWRAAGSEAEHRPEQLPPDLAEKCLALTRSYGLEFAAIDLASTNAGDYVFFEINPNGQWAWIEQITGQPLRSCLADLLEGAAL